MGAVLVEVLIVLAFITIVIVTTVSYYDAYQKQRAAALKGSCGLFSGGIFPDECLGVCPSGQTCTVTKWTSYAIFFSQAAACSCRAPATPAVGAATTGADGIAPVR
jgi:hypothetical protein